jgi:hypothetical protein
VRAGGVEQCFDQIALRAELDRIAAGHLAIQARDPELARSWATVHVAGIESGGQAVRDHWICC